MEPDVKCYRIVRRLPGGSTYILGWATRYEEGWRFVSNVASHRSGRVHHDTMKACLPRWARNDEAEAA